MDEPKSKALQRGRIASPRHTFLLCAILLAIAAAGYLSIARSAGTPGAGGIRLSGAGLYLPLIAAEWGLFLYVRLGVRKAGGSIRNLVSARPPSGRALAVDLLLGLALLGAWLAAEYLLGQLVGSARPEGMRPLLVRHAAEVPLWVLLALSAGFVEELTFRGYLQRQFGAMLGSPWLGVAAQAVLFGVTHGYQGGIPMLAITVFGLMFGAFALIRGSLVPGMFAHAAVDVIGGLAAFR